MIRPPLTALLLAPLLLTGAPLAANAQESGAMQLAPMEPEDGDFARERDFFDEEAFRTLDRGENGLSIIEERGEQPDLTTLPTEPDVPWLERPLSPAQLRVALAQNPRWWRKTALPPPVLRNDWAARPPRPVAEARPVPRPAVTAPPAEPVVTPPPPEGS